MQLFKEVDIFDRRTGEVDGTDLVLDKVICDYCGKEIDLNDANHPETCYEIHEIGGSEEEFYYLDYPAGVDKYKLFTGENSKFHFCQNFDHSDHCEFKLLVEWHDNLTNAESCFHLCFLLAHILYHSRLRMIKKLLADGQTPEQLGIQEED